MAYFAHYGAMVVNVDNLWHLRHALIKAAEAVGIIKASIPDDHPHRRLLAKLEPQVQADVTAALQQLQTELFDGIDRGNIWQVLTRLQSREVNERLRLALYDALLPTVETGTAVGKAQVEAEVLGVKAIWDVGFDWTLANTAAAEWLEKQTFLLTYANVYSITKSTEAALRGMIAEFAASPDMTMQQLIRKSEALFDVVRGESIAVTETTRAFAQGNAAAWRESGVIESKRWNTARDELVCPICGQLSGRVVGMDENFNGLYDGPPAHPRCRCWLTPVVTVPDAPPTEAA